MELNDAPFWEYHSGKISENSNRNFGKRKPLKRSNFKGLGWRSRWDSNPRAFWANGFQDFGRINKKRIKNVSI